MRRAIAVNPRVFLRRPTPADQPEFLVLVRRSASLHRPWTTAPATPAQFRAYLARNAIPANCTLLVCRRDTRAIVGVVNITQIVLGLFRSAYLGYYVFAGSARQGLMREGLQGALRFAFNTLKLHRLEANIQPRNAASIALVKSCGFVREGYSPSYLKIGGRWRDHERWAILRHNRANVVAKRSPNS